MKLTDRQLFFILGFFAGMITFAMISLAVVVVSGLS